MEISQRRNTHRPHHDDAIFFALAHLCMVDYAHRERSKLDRPPAHQGVDAILNNFLDSLMSHGPACTPRELQSLQQSLLDMTSDFLSRHLGACNTLPAETGEKTALQRIHSFIETNLADPCLTPQAVADRHHISLSTLYALFRTQEEGVAAWIRRRRLERCRADLVAVDQRQRPIHVIAARWGFTDAAAFSRAFRNAYGVSPRAFRQQARVA
ncbi:helix-turn-helix domain-containing protein [Streptomyces sp. NPDC000594]|uniref:helix-turn-helix domain-containing protein n=1 Tax=Streptomyces sp. NPDC000594 TaxID=3154261 RepID=UPI00331DD757